LNTIAENELINRCKNGDMKSYELLYARYSHAMYHTCLRIVNNTSDAEDMLQETFLDAFTTLKKLKDTRAFAGWLKRIAINKSLNYVNRQKRAWVELDGITDTDVPEEEIVDEELFRFKIEAIQKELVQLPENQRIVISLHVFEDLDFEEIAELAGIPSSTVRSHYARGRQRVLNKINH